MIVTSNKYCNNNGDEISPKMDGNNYCFMLVEENLNIFPPGNIQSQLYIISQSDPYHAYASKIQHFFLS